MRSRNERPLTGHALKEWQDFEQRRADEASNKSAAAKLLSSIPSRSPKKGRDGPDRRRTPKFMIGRAFKSGGGVLS